MRTLGLALAFVCIAVGTTQQAQAGAVCGDVNGDGKVTWSDVQKIADAQITRKPLSANQEKLADVNLNGKMDAKDADQVAFHLMGRVKCLPCPANRNACQRQNRQRGRLPGFL